MICGVGGRQGSDLALLWLWCRPAATALIGPLAWESPYAAGAVLQRQKKKKKKRRGGNLDTRGDTRHEHSQKKDHVKTQPEGGHLQAMQEASEKKPQPRQHFDLGFPGSRIVRQYIWVMEAAQFVALSYNTLAREYTW